MRDAAIRSVIVIAGVYGMALLFNLSTLFLERLFHWLRFMKFLHWPIGFLYGVAGPIHELFHSAWCTIFRLRIHSIKERETRFVLDTNNLMQLTGCFFACLGPTITCSLLLFIVLKHLPPLLVIPFIPPLSIIGTASRTDVVGSFLGLIPAFFFTCVMITAFRFVISLI